MSHLLKLNASTLALLLRHYERTINDGVQYRKNAEIDKSRTHLNYEVLSGATGENAILGTLRQRLDERLAQLEYNKTRKDIVIAATWIVTLPEELKGEPPELQRQFFGHVVEFIQQRYGKENLIAAWVHNDETTPHVHLTFTPEQRATKEYNNFEGTGKLHAKSLLNREELRFFHHHLQAHLEAAMGRKLAILNGATAEAGGNQSIDELKAETALEQEKAQEAAKAIQQAAEQWTESGKQAAALSELLGDSVKDAKRQAERGGFLKSGWEKKLKALLKGLASVQEQEKTAQRAASALTDAARLVPDWAKSGTALQEAALQLSAKARQDTQEEKKRLQDWWQKRARKVSAREKAVTAAETALDERREAFGREVDQAARALLDAEGGKLAAAQRETAAALAQQQQAEQARDDAQRQQQQAVDALTAARQQAQQAEQARDAAQRQQQQAERARDEAREQAESWRQQGTPSAKLRAVLDECARRFGDGAVMTALQHAITKGIPSAAAERMAHIEIQQAQKARAVRQSQPAAQQTPTPNRRPGLTR